MPAMMHSIMLYTSPFKFMFACCVRLALQLGAQAEGCFPGHAHGKRAASAARCSTSVQADIHLVHPADMMSHLLQNRRHSALPQLVQVAVRCRPLTRKERQQGSHVITRTIDEKVNAQMTILLAGTEQSCLTGEAGEGQCCLCPA